MLKVNEEWPGVHERRFPGCRPKHFIIKCSLGVVPLKRQHRMEKQDGKEFEEVGHCGGQVTFIVRTNSAGSRSFQVKWSGARNNKMATFAVYAIPQGVAVGSIDIGGIGQPWNPPPIPNCYPVFVSSDSEGRFGHQCPSCNGYWRSEGGVSICPYCGTRADRHMLLTCLAASTVRSSFHSF